MKHMNETLVKFFSLYFIILETTAHVKQGAAKQALKKRGTQCPAAPPERSAADSLHDVSCLPKPIKPVMIKSTTAVSAKMQMVKMRGTWLGSPNMTMP